VVTLLTRSATDFAVAATPDAARVTVARLGSETRFADFFALARRAPDDVLRADDLRVEDLRADDLRADDLRADDLRADDLRALDFLAADLRLDAAFRDPDERLPADFLALLPRELLDAERRDDDLRAEDLRPPERLELFFAPLEPPRDDFLAAAISELRYRGSRRRIATFAHKHQQ
jgi:hypothetical protein